MPGGDRQTILFINHWAANMGGAEYSLQDILLHMAGRSDCHLVTSEDGALCRRARGAGVTCHVVPCSMRQRSLQRIRLLSDLLFSLPDIISFLRYVLGVRRLVKRLAPSLIHANVPKSHVALFCLSRLGYRGVCCFHIRELFTRNSVPLLLYGALFPRRNGTVLAISGAVRDSLPKRMRMVCTMIYNGVVVQKVSRPSAESAKDARGKTRYLYCGRVVPWKGCHLLVEMFHEAKKRLPGAVLELSLVGDTSYWPQEYRGRLAADIRDRGLDKCCFLLPNTGDVGALYAGHDVFVNASLREPFGRSIAEAQGAGLPVVSFDSGGVSEIVAHGHSGILAPYGDRESFVKALADFVRKPGLAGEMGEAGRKRALQFFDRDIQVPKIGEFLLSRSG
jgi:glycosyltransferase involved in cell wall biosynthesis